MNQQKLTAIEYFSWQNFWTQFNLISISKGYDLLHIWQLIRFDFMAYINQINQVIIYCNV